MFWKNKADDVTMTRSEMYAKNIVVATSMTAAIEAVVKKYNLPAKEAVDLFQDEFAKGIRTGVEAFGGDSSFVDEAMDKD